MMDDYEVQLYRAWIFFSYIIMKIIENIDQQYALFVLLIVGNKSKSI